MVASPNLLNMLSSRLQILPSVCWGMTGTLKGPQAEVAQSYTGTGKARSPSNNQLELRPEDRLFSAENETFDGAL